MRSPRGVRVLLAVYALALPARDSAGSCPVQGALPVACAPPAAAAARLLPTGEHRSARLRSDQELRRVTADSGATPWSSRGLPERVARELASGLPAGPAAFLHTSAGVTYRGYFADSRGTVWRLDFPAAGGDGHADLHTLQPIARLGEGGVRFDGAPELVQSRDARGRPFEGILLTGRRRDTDGESRVVVYYLRDFAISRHAAAGDPITPDQLADAAGCAPVAAACAARAAGWRAELRVPGEVPVGRALIEGGRIFLSTLRPASMDSVSGEASGRLLGFDLATGAPLTGVSPVLRSGRWRPGAVRLAAGRLQFPGSGDSALPARARGAVVYRRFWRDLLLDPG